MSADETSPAPMRVRPRDVAEVDAWLARAVVPEGPAVMPSDEVVDHANRMVLERAATLVPTSPLPVAGCDGLDPRSYARLLLLTTRASALDVAAHLHAHYPLSAADAVLVTCAALV